MTEQRTHALEQFWSESYFPCLDGIRAFCLLLVMFNHIHTPSPTHIVGWLGVDIFFVLSGFLITTLLLREREKYGSISLKGFYTRRCFRIIPVYLVVLLLYVPVILLTHDVKRWQEFKMALPYLLTFMQEFRPLATGTVYGQTWSLGFEEKFYFIWPLLTLLLFPFFRRSLLLTFAIGGAILLLPSHSARSYGGLFLGSLCALLLAKTTGDRIKRAMPALPVWAAAALVAASYVLTEYKPRSVLLFSFSITLLTATLVLRQSWLRSFLSHRFLVLLGKRSYAMYLIHVLIIGLCEKLAHKAHVYYWFVVVPAAYFGSFLGATALFHLVERPCVEQGRKLSRGMRQRLTEKMAMRLPLVSGVQPLETPVDV